MNATTKNIVFDWNGTLLDDTHSVLEAVNIVLAKVGRAPIDMRTFSDGHNWPMKIEDKDWPVRSFYRDIGLTEVELDKIMEIERDIFHDNYKALADRAALRPGATQILKDLQAEGVQPLI